MFAAHFCGKSRQYKILSNHLNRLGVQKLFDDKSRLRYQKHLVADLINDQQPRGLFTRDNIKCVYLNERIIYNSYLL